MTRETKGRAGWHQATSNISKYAFYFTVLASCEEAVITNPVLSNWQPARVEVMFSNQRGLLNE